jgi:hypothetical protein
MLPDHSRARRILVAAAAPGLVMRLAISVVYWVSSTGWESR